MNIPSSVITFEFDPLKRRLTAIFDTMRKVVFYEVAPETAALLTDVYIPDEAQTRHILREHAWAEIGAPPSYLGDTRG